MKEVVIYTDGACSGNPGPGGYGAILTYGAREKCISGGERETTNNRMELTAVIEALSLLREPCRVKIVSDSRYVVDAVQKGWLKSWAAKGWKKADRSPVLNRELWEKLLPLLARHEVNFSWVQGHAGHPYNERCDAMAVEETKKRS